MQKQQKQGKKGRLFRYLLLVFFLAASVYLIQEKILQRAETDLWETYPDYLAELYEKNPEARDFVLAYPDHRDSDEPGAIAAEELDGGIPLLLQWDSRWGYHAYGSAILGVTGCGPSCLSMVAAGLTGDTAISPAAVSDFSESSGYYVEGSGSDWALMTEGAAHFGLEAQELPLSEEIMAEALAGGRPLIVSLGPGDFTDSGHFVVLTDYSGGDFGLHDPNSPKNSGKRWSYEALSPQILNIWAYSPVSS